MLHECYSWNMETWSDVAKGNLLRGQSYDSQISQNYEETKGCIVSSLHPSHENYTQSTDLLHILLSNFVYTQVALTRITARSVFSPVRISTLRHRLLWVERDCCADLYN